MYKFLNKNIYKGRSTSNVKQISHLRVVFVVLIFVSFLGLQHKFPFRGIGMWYCTLNLIERKTSRNIFRLLSNIFMVKLFAKINNGFQNLLFSRKTPPQIFNRVLNTPLPLLNWNKTFIGISEIAISTFLGNPTSNRRQFPLFKVFTVVTSEGKIAKYGSHQYDWFILIHFYILSLITQVWTLSFFAINIISPISVWLSVRIKRKCFPFNHMRLFHSKRNRQLSCAMEVKPWRNKCFSEKTYLQGDFCLSGSY